MPLADDTNWQACVTMYARVPKNDVPLA
jgi:hypothetical protein